MGEDGLGVVAELGPSWVLMAEDELAVDVDGAGTGTGLTALGLMLELSARSG